VRALCGELLLRAWEEAAEELDLKRPLALLAVALPEHDRERLEAIPLAARNRLLLRLYQLSFGPLLKAVVKCQACDELLEFSVAIGALECLTDAERGCDALEWEEGGHVYRLRAVTTSDLVATMTVDEPTRAQELLLARCLTVDSNRSRVRAPACGVAVEKFEELHAETELMCSVDCPACAHHEVVDLDIARFLWTEVARAGRRLLQDVSRLASRYGWSEQVILTMPRHRRAAYLELIDA
jgi:hypothetical protein